MYYVETRQTARKSTGGRAPRKQLATKNGKPDFLYLEREKLKNEYTAVLKYLEYMCNTYESFEEQIEEEQDPKQLLENFKSITEYVYEDLQTTFNEMKSIIDTPKCFLIEHFDGLRNRIDLECQNYIDNNELKLESKEKAILQQQEMIDEVDSFQKQCLASLKTKQTYQINLEEFEKRLQLQDKDEVMQLGKDLCCAIHNIKRELFMNQGIVFYTRDNYKKLFDFHKEQNRHRCSCHNQDYRIDLVMFGSLILIEDEFLIDSDTIESWSEYMSNGYEDEQIEVDYCNEFLMINLLERSIIQNINHKTVTRIQLNRTKENDLKSQFFHSSETLVEKWSSDLPSLKKLNLDRLDKTKMFQHLVNLEELEIWCMDLAKVDSNIFACNKNLRKLKIRGRVLTLNNQSFNGLVNLTEFKLSSENIVALPDGLFDSCTALKVVNLSCNKLIELETSSFQSLVSLEELDLSYNSIKELDSNMFLRNKKLIKLRLYKNKITKLNEDFFKGLSQLTHLDLTYNEMFSLPECPFDNCLKVVNLSHNKFIELETLSFQSLVNLEELDLSYNSIERADYSNIFACNKNLRKLNLSHISSTSLNNQSFNGLEDLFNGSVNLTYINLSDNRIMSLPDGIFQNLINLKELDLSFNQISELTSSLFNNLVSLENLNLNLNKLTNIPKGLFDNLISLKFLNLKENEIELQKDSDPNIFIGLRKLTGLELEGNQISFLPEGIFKNLVSLEELGLEQNHIMSLPKDFFKDLISLKSLRLRSNFIDTEGEDPLWIDKKNIKPFPKHIQLDLNEYDDSDDPNSTDEMINEQNDPEADAEKDTKKRDRDCKENVGETLDVHDDESNPKRFKN